MPDATAATPGQEAPTAVDVPALMKDHVRLTAELRELIGTHETLLEEILRNADEDINGGDEAPEYLAEAYVRFLERERNEARAEMAEVRRIAYQGGQDAASVRRELLAYLEARDDA